MSMVSVCRQFICIAGVVSVVCSSTFGLAQEEKPERWRYLTVTVMNAEGHLLSGLTTSDFEIREQGKRCEIKSFSASDEPVTVGFLIDTSGSMQKTWLNSKMALRNLIADFISNSHPENEYFVVNLSDSTKLQQDFTNDPALILDAVVTGGLGKTVLYDAVYLSLTKASLQSGKKALILFSDGMDNTSSYTFEELKSAIAESDCLIYAIFVANLPFASRDGEIKMETMANLTGGMEFSPQTGSELVLAMRRVAAELRHQYRIGYRPQPAQEREWRKVTVKVREKPGLGKLKVRACQKYLAMP